MILDSRQTFDTLQTPESMKTLETNPRKWVPRPLTSVCGVCGGPSTKIKHYGSVACYSCRAFFRRSVGSSKPFKMCKGNSGTICTITANNRNKCKKCRYYLCIQIGMLPEKVDRVKRKRMLEEGEEGVIHEEDRSNVEDDGTQEEEEQQEDGHHGQDEQQEDGHHGQEEQQVDGHHGEDGHCVREEQDHIQRRVEVNEIKQKQEESKSIPPDNTSLVSPQENGTMVSRRVTASSAEAVRSKTSKMVSEKNVRKIKKKDDMSRNSKKTRVGNETEAKRESGTVSSSRVPQLLYLDLTLEEEFRIHEIIVRKDDMLSQKLRSQMKYPHFLVGMKRFIRSVSGFSNSSNSTCSNNSSSCLATIIPTAPSPLERCRQILEMEKRQLFWAIDIFHEARYLDPDCLVKTLEFSLPVVQICIRAYMHANCDKRTLVEQQKASGTLNQGLIECYLASMLSDKSGNGDQPVSPRDQHVIERVANSILTTVTTAEQHENNAHHLILNLKSFDPLALDIFKSPWAETRQYEEKFEQTIDALGEIVGEDNMLGSLYIMLILVTPGYKTIQNTQTDHYLISIQNELTLLIYRYLRHKYQSPDIATSQIDSLLRMIGELHDCRNIHLNKRIPHKYSM